MYRAKRSGGNRVDSQEPFIPLARNGDRPLERALSS